MYLDPVIRVALFRSLKLTHAKVGETTDESLAGPASVAYTATLSRYHGWMVRGLSELSCLSNFSE
jgi:hypothetical protein